MVERIQRAHAGRFWFSDLVDSVGVRALDAFDHATGWIRTQKRKVGLWLPVFTGL